LIFDKQLCHGLSLLTLTYTTPDSGLTYTYPGWNQCYKFPCVL